MKLQYDKLLSRFAFNFNLRRYTVVTAPLPPTPHPHALAAQVGAAPSVRAWLHSLGRAVQVNSIKTRVESACGFSA